MQVWTVGILPTSPQFLKSWLEAPPPRDQAPRHHHFIFLGFQAKAFSIQQLSLFTYSLVSVSPCPGGTRESKDMECICCSHGAGYRGSAHLGHLVSWCRWLSIPRASGSEWEVVLGSQERSMSPFMQKEPVLISLEFSAFGILKGRPYFSFKNVQLIWEIK